MTGPLGENEVEIGELGDHDFNTQLTQRIDARDWANEAPHAIAATDEGLDQVPANEAVGASDENRGHATGGSQID